MNRKGFVSVIAAVFIGFTALFVGMFVGHKAPKVFDKPEDSQSK